MADIEGEIDRLFQLPLSEFTAARDALVKRAGARAAVVRALQKPNAAAWAINQLYWKRRKTFDRLVTAFDRVRAAQAARLGGKAADVAALEAAHQGALAAAERETRDLLAAAGDAASPATMAAVSETLHAIPSTRPDGRLTRPLRPFGFDALATLMGAKTLRPAHQADIVPLHRAARQAEVKQAARVDADRARVAADAHRGKIAEATRELEGASAAERDARKALDHARRTRERADETRARLDRELDAATTHRTTALREEQQAAERAKRATQEREQFERQLATLRAASPS